MSHVVLARKYRPKSFKDVKGQDILVKSVQASLAKGKVPAAILFTGSRGIGKTTIARIVAKALVCKDEQSKKMGEPCNACTSCKAIDEFRYLDVIEIDGASNTSVENIRDLKESAQFLPSLGPYKIFIIDEVHMLSISAFNALLKILEEPPDHIKFLFATTESQKIPKTVLSRCQIYSLKRFSLDLIKETLKEQLSKENIAFDDDALFLIAKLSDGAMRDAQSLCETIIVDEQKNYTKQMVINTLGLMSESSIKAIGHHIVYGDAKEAVKEIFNIYKAGIDLGEASESLCEYFRNLSLLSLLTSLKEAESVNVYLNEEDFKIAKENDVKDLKRLFSMALDCALYVKKSDNALFALEYQCIKMALRPKMSDAVTISHLLNKLENLSKDKEIKTVHTVQTKQYAAREINTHLEHKKPNIFVQKKQEEESLKNEALKNPLVQEIIKTFDADLISAKKIKLHDVT